MGKPTRPFVFFFLVGTMQWVGVALDLVCVGRRGIDLACEHAGMRTCRHAIWCVWAGVALIWHANMQACNLVCVGRCSVDLACKHAGM